MKKPLSLDQLFIIATGGTVDKSYGTGAGVHDLSFPKEPAVAGILQQIQTTTDYSVLRLLAKDSLDMDDRDRVVITAMCVAIPQSRILITHGTDTMHLTAKAIASRRLNKTIVITGASQPAVVTGSDANFNIGFAMSSALQAERGVYIAMNARLHAWNKCKKNPVTGIFEAI